MLRRLLLMSALIPLPAHAEIEPGNWELSMTTVVQGMPKPTSTMQTRCFSAEETRDPSRFFGPAPGAACEYTNRQDSGSVFTFQVKCAGQPPWLGSGSVRYSRDSMDGEFELKADAGGQPFVTLTRISGRRLGGC